MSILLFQPIYQPRVWAGHLMKDKFHRDIPPGSIGESWDIVDRPQAQSLALNVRFKGQTLHAILQQASQEILGPHWPKNQPFPLLIKWIDAAEKLSLQVHPGLYPDPDIEPKTECWYIADTIKNSKIYLGFKEKISPDDFRKQCTTPQIQEWVHTVETKPTDMVFVPAGRLHAIGEGHLVLEIQQNSDTTYRLYDWDRLGQDGKPRTLHLEQGSNCIDFKDIQPTTLASTHEDTSVRIDCPYFRVTEHILRAGQTLELKSNQSAKILSIVDGSLHLPQDDLSLSFGTNALIPFSTSLLIETSSFARLLITDQFS